MLVVLPRASSAGSAVTAITLLKPVASCSVTRVSSIKSVAPLVILGSKTIQEGSPIMQAAFVGTIFAIAGISKDVRNTSVPKYVIGSATFGEPNPPGAVDRKFNPVITSAGLNQADGAFGLNMGLRTYARGHQP
jgi:hypothetical protein